MPFSDPLADGPVIQRATERALASGTTLSQVLDLLGRIRSSVKAPFVIFSYANPILRLGAERFADRARDAGVDGVLVLDLPDRGGRRLPEHAGAFGGLIQSSCSARRRLMNDCEGRRPLAVGFYMRSRALA